MTAEYSATNRPGAAESLPGLVTLDVWKVRGIGIPRAFLHMGADRLALRRTPGLRFWKLLGTGSGLTFTMSDADPTHWALLTVWDDAQDARRFTQSRMSRSWRRFATEHARFEMRPLASRGTWAGRTPFGDPLPQRWDGPVAALTRARIKPSLWRTFWSSVPPVSTDLHEGGGLQVALGIGEAPLGLQGTFSIWDSNSALSAFAHRRSPHRVAMEQTEKFEWYAEELFARFALVGASGVYEGKPVELGGVEPGGVEPGSGA